jgi:hypothetical protein
MSYSISASTSFSSINWNNFENRPPINPSMTFCEEKDWYEDVKCCMDSYSIEHVRDVAHEHGLGDTPEVRFLDRYPCVNGLELDYFVDEIEAMPSNVNNNPTPPESPYPPATDRPCDMNAIKAFIKIAQKLGLGNFADIAHLEKEPNVSCETIMGMAFRYGALALELGRDINKRLSSKASQ